MRIIILIGLMFLSSVIPEVKSQELHSIQKDSAVIGEKINITTSTLSSSESATNKSARAQTAYQKNKGLIAGVIIGIVLLLLLIK
jgi:hypothetical protein